MPGENDDNSRTYKYPFVSSEILSSDSTAILDMFFREEVNKYYIPEDNDKPLLLTLKFKKEFISKREKHQPEDSGMVVDTEKEDKGQPEENPFEQVNTEEEAKQGNKSTLGSNNAEVLGDEAAKPVHQVKLKQNLITNQDNKNANQEHLDDKSGQNNENTDKNETDNAEKGIKNNKEDGEILPNENTKPTETDNQNNEPDANMEVEENHIKDIEDNKNNQEESQNVCADGTKEYQTGSDVNMQQEEEVNLGCDEEMNESTTATIPTNYTGDKYELLDMLFNFILSKERGEEVNPVLSGYFQKVVLALLTYKQKQMMNYIYNKDKLMNKMLEHVYDKSICDVLIKILNISNSTPANNNNSINNDSGEIFDTHNKSSQKEVPDKYSKNYEESRNEIIHKLIDKLIKAKTIEEYWNASSVLCEMAKFQQLFEFLSSPEIMDKISIGLENDDEEGITCTISLYNVILREYSKDGTNKRVNISNLQDEEE